MEIKDLPKSGISFRASKFKKKLSDATKHGSLVNLRDNQEAIFWAIEEREREIKVKGGLDRRQRNDAVKKIKKGSHVTGEDLREIKQIVNHFGRGAAVKEKKPPIEAKLIKTEGKKSLWVPVKRIGLNLKRNMARDEVGRQFSKTQYGGATVRTPYLGARTDKPANFRQVPATMADLNIKARTTGFASQNLNNNNPAGNSSPVIPQITRGR